MMRTGQCHRYHAYDRSPTYRNTVVDRIRPAPTTRFRGATPAAMTSAAPTVGSNAAAPGNAVLLEYATAAAAIAASPAQPTTCATHRGIDRSRAATIASAAPSASSHIRPRVEKYAPAGDTRTSWTDEASESAAAARITASSRKRPRPEAAPSRSSVRRAARRGRSARPNRPTAITDGQTK